MLRGFAAFRTRSGAKRLLYLAQLSLEHFSVQGIIKLSEQRRSAGASSALAGRFFRFPGCGGCRARQSTIWSVKRMGKTMQNFTEQTHTLGLYDPQFEHDACGIGAVVDIKGRKSHH